MIGPQSTGAVDGVVISAQSHTGLKVTACGKPALLAVVTADGEIIAAGDSVAKEAEAVAINAYRNFLAGRGYLKIYSKPLQSRPNVSGIDALPRSERECTTGRPK